MVLGLLFTITQDTIIILALGGGMILIFLLVGLGLIWLGLKEGLLRLRARPRLQVVKGVVTRIETKSKQMLVNGKRTYDVHRFPVIHFQTATGEAFSFQSEVGEVEQRYRHPSWWTPKRKRAETFEFVAGQALPVLYDPAGEVPPCINRWSAIFGPAVTFIWGGLAFCVGSGLLWLVYRTRIINAIWDVFF
ncbi:MAG: DUF3592 domain-containing protein [Caldilineaceae bacterium]